MELSHQQTLLYHDFDALIIAYHRCTRFHRREQYSLQEKTGSGLSTHERQEVMVEMVLSHPSRVTEHRATKRTRRNIKTKRRDERQVLVEPSA